MASESEESTRSAQQRAYGFIREKIIDGTYSGGAKLNPTRIADDLDLSRMPVREALRQLDAEGLVTMRPNRGAIVTTLTVEEIEELFEMRAALEGLAARRAAKMIQPEQRAELRRIVQDMGRAAGTPHAWLKLHDDFHELLCAISGWERLAADIRKIRSAVHPYLLLYNNVYHETEMMGAEHIGLVMAIETGNQLLAERVAADHVMSAGAGVVQWLKHSSKFDNFRDAKMGSVGNRQPVSVSSGRNAKAA